MGLHRCLRSGKKYRNCAKDEKIWEMPGNDKENSRVEQDSGLAGCANAFPEELTTLQGMGTLYGQLPLGLLVAAQGSPMLVELKNGETLNGHLVTCDTWMNLTLKEVIQTSPEGDRFFRLPEVYVKGNNIKFLQMPNEVIDNVKDQQQGQQAQGCRHWAQLAERKVHQTSMPPTRIPIDGLWRCLCPSIDSFVLSRTSSRPTLISKYSTRQVTKKIVRLQSNNVRTEIDYYKSFGSIDPNRASHPTKNERSTLLSTTNYSPNLLRPKLDDIPLERLHDLLRELPHDEGAYHAVTNLVGYLVTVRREKPALIHYDALIRANADAENGSADAVKVLLQEMKDTRIGPDSRLYHGVLLVGDALEKYTCLLNANREIQVLSIHPDYLLRAQILDEIEERWIGLSPIGWHHLVVSFIRDRQYESAIDKLEQMHADEIRVQPWLYDIFIHISFNLYEGTNFIWQLQVLTEHLKASDGICVNVLNLAARNADPALATSALRTLSSRLTSLSAHHYEALLAAYVGFGDLNTSFRILNIMAKAGFKPNSSTTRPFYHYLKRRQSLPSTAWKTLQQLYKDGHPVPTAAVNVVIEASVFHQQFLDAVEIYKGLHKICEAGPNTETYNIIFQGARVHNKGIAMFLVSEMTALGVKPDQLTYDRLILICALEEDYEDAFRYLEEMIIVGKDQGDLESGKGWWMRRGTAQTLARKCIEHNDERALYLLDEMNKRGQQPSAKLITDAGNLFKHSAKDMSEGGESKIKEN
ncbi:hypothetical protein B7494_g1702 [Chlorociboria aeruginascens]|nr:hypothetical protein B7494_g1702 [Chlorociboria aeruginascens]